MPRNKIVTWADGFGLWYARVELGVKAPSDLLNPASLRTVARRAIRREIQARQAGEVAPVRVFVYDNELDSMNRMLSITYKEL